MPFSLSSSCWGLEPWWARWRSGLAGGVLLTKTADEGHPGGDPGRAGQAREQPSALPRLWKL